MRLFKCLDRITFLSFIRPNSNRKNDNTCIFHNRNSKWNRIYIQTHNGLLPTNSLIRRAILCDEITNSIREPRLDSPNSYRRYFVKNHPIASRLLTTWSFVGFQAHRSHHPAFDVPSTESSRCSRFEGWSINFFLQPQNSPVRASSMPLSPLPHFHSLSLSLPHSFPSQKTKKWKKRSSGTANGEQKRDERPWI